MISRSRVLLASGFELRDVYGHTVNVGQFEALGQRWCRSGKSRKCEIIPRDLGNR
jgi:hypothetical protein